jgi:GR25 family glycosyltransferase involved in LPS biosynthesis
MAACGLSHNLAYKFIINENLPAALVFEDDIFLTKSIKKSTNIFNQIYHKELPKNFDILFLERCLDNKKLQKRYSPHLFIPDAPQCSAARLISLNGARKLLTITQPFYGPHDKMIADSIHQHSLRAFASNPMLFGQDGRYESNIGDYPGQQNLKKPFLSKRSPEYYCPKKHNIIYRWWKVTETKLKKIKPLKILVKKIKDLC